MSNCDSCHKLRALLAQKDFEIAAKISEIQHLRASLASHASTEASAKNLDGVSVLGDELKDALVVHLAGDKESHANHEAGRNGAVGQDLSLDAVHGLEPVASTARLSATSSSSDDDDVMYFDPNLRMGLFDMFGQTFSLVHIEKVLNQVRWNQERAVSQLLAEHETGVNQPQGNQTQHVLPCKLVQTVVDGKSSFSSNQNLSRSILSVKMEENELLFYEKPFTLKPSASKSSRSPSPALDTKRPRVDLGHQIIRKLKSDICHEMESGKDCLDLIMEFNELLPDKWFLEPLIGVLGFPGPRIFHLACSDDTFSSTLSYLMEQVIAQERGVEYCKELLMMPVCPAFVDWKKPSHAHGTDKKRTESRISRKQPRHEKMYSLGIKCCAFHIASHHGALSCAAILLKMAQRVDAAAQGVDSDLFSVSLLMQGGSVKDVKYRDWEPRPLDLASAAGHINIMRLFVHHIRQCCPQLGLTPKIFVNRPGKGCSCALHWAAECSKVASIEYLLQQGADPDSRDSTGGTAVDYVINNAAIHKALPPTAQDEFSLWLPDETWLSQIQSFAKLLQYGASTILTPNALVTSALTGYSDYSGSKLQAAVLSKNMVYLQTILYELCDGSFDIDCCVQMQKHDSGSFLSPLGLACVMGWSEGVLMLLEAGARQLPDERRKMTPLMLAAARGHDPIIRILVSPRFFASMSPRENEKISKHGDSGGSARIRFHKLHASSKASGQGSFIQRYYPALLNMLRAQSANDRRAVDWASFRNHESNSCAVFLRKLYAIATTMQQSIDSQQIACRHIMPSEPVILQRSFLSWEYMRYFAAKHFEALNVRSVSTSMTCRSPASHGADGCSCGAMFCVPGLCFCLKGDMNSRGAADLGCLRDDGMNLDIDFAHPFVADQCETLVRYVQEKGFAVEVFSEFYSQMHTFCPGHYTDCSWLSIGTKLTTSDGSAPHSGEPFFCMTNLIGTALVLQLLPRLLTSGNCESISWRWSDPLYCKFREEIVASLFNCCDTGNFADCFDSFKKRVLDLCSELAIVCEGTSCWGRAMLHDWQDFGFHVWRAEVLCCDVPLALCHCMKDLACRFRCMQSHLRIRVKSKPSKLSSNVGQLLLCDATKCGCPCALTSDQVMHLGVVPEFLEKRPSEYCQHAPDGRPGLGLFTHIPLQSGSLVAPYLGELMLSSENLHDEEQYKQEGLMCYSFELPLSEDSNLRPPGRENKIVVDPTRFGGLARFVNHSCHPNLDFVMVRAGKDIPVLYLYANTDIAPQTELTMSYGSQLTYACMCSHCRQLKAKKENLSKGGV